MKCRKCDIDKPDHGNGNESITGRPHAWMRSRPCTAKHQLIFESCNFGLLCNVYNLRLPTHDRRIWLKQAIKYYEGYTNA